MQRGQKQIICASLLKDIETVVGILGNGDQMNHTNVLGSFFKIYFIVNVI